MAKKAYVIEKEILKKFMYNEELSYNEIWDKSLCSSSNFDYHLKKLLDKNLLTKKGNKYTLNANGIELISSVDGSTLKNNKKPIPCAFVLVKNNEGKILLSIRKKQPYFNVLGILGGKIEFGETSKECALRELKEETGIECDIELKVISEIITYNLDENNKVEHNIIGFFFLGENPRGKLIKKNREGENIWVSPNDIKKYEKFPDLDYIYPILLKNEELRFVRLKRYRKKGKFKNCEIEKK